jgi:hypothetical protein
VFYYGEEDGWAPREFYKTMKLRLPQSARVFVDEDGISHDFCIR